MAESRGSLIAKSVQKHAGRAKEKILQNLGKVDRTADDIFDEHLQNFTRQQNAANRLQKEFSNYIRCIRTAQVAAKSLLEAIGDVYESQWSGHDLLFVHTQSVDMLWQDFSHKLADQVLIPLNTYQSQFPEMRKKIDKRGRKLVDYDGQRHSFQALQTNMSKKRDEAKISKGRELLEEAKRTYEMLNSELHDELPALHDSRILFLVTNLQTLFNAEHVFHSETAKIYGELEAIVDKLATESQRGSYSVKKSNGASHLLSSQPKEDSVIMNNVSSPIKNNNSVPSDLPNLSLNLSSKSAAIDSNFNQTSSSNHSSPTQETPPSKSPPLSSPNSPKSMNQTQMDKDINKDKSPPTTPDTVVVDTTSTNNANNVLNVLNLNDLNGIKDRDSMDVKKEIAEKNSKSEVLATTTEKTPPSSPLLPPTSSSASSPSSDNNKLSKDGAATKPVEDLYDIPVGASTENLPPGVLYRVRATYKYNREDVDELSFDVGEIINVVEYDDPEEQEEGWLMGIKASSAEKGMFPANFTRPL